MRSSEVRNLKLFEMRKKIRILELSVTNFARTLSELPKQPIVHCVERIRRGKMQNFGGESSLQTIGLN